MDDILALRPFVPAADPAVSSAFYEALGFRCTYADAHVAMLKLGGFSLILQSFYNKEMAENLMIQLMVRDADAWFAGHVDGPALVERFAVKPPRPPAMQDWGMKVGFLFDPAGVLWHVAEAVF